MAYERLFVPIFRRFFLKILDIGNYIIRVS